jgi:hypothetical protein
VPFSIPVGVRAIDGGKQCHHHNPRLVNRGMHGRRWSKHTRARVLVLVLVDLLICRIVKVEEDPRKVVCVVDLVALPTTAARFAPSVECASLATG